MRLRLFTLLTSFLIFSTTFSAELDYGLFIKSYPFKPSEMSHLVLEDGNAFELKESIKLTFEMYVRNDNVFGNTFRIVTDKNETIDLLFTVGENDKRFPIFVINESVHPISQEVIRDKWIPISVILSPEENQITLWYEETKISVPYPISDSRSFRMSFGLCPFDGFLTADVASVNLRNIEIYKKDKLFRSWKLEKHHGDICYDSLANVPAISHNPYWLIDDYITWQKIYETELPSATSIAFNPGTDEFYMVNNSENIMVFNANSLQTHNIKVKGGLYSANSPNQLFYIPEKKTLLSYNLNEDLYSFFSFDAQTWSNHTPSTKEHGYWNNSITFYSTDSAIVSFGGYGFYRYNNELLLQYPFGNKPNEKIQLTEISPRYTAGTAIVGNTLYIFGGRGCKSGRQELFPKNYYDLYSVNLLTRQVNKLWEVPTDGIEFVSGENMIYNKEEDCFYMFTTRSGGMLLKITTKDATFEPMSLAINEGFEAQMLYTNLYYSESQKKLFALVNKMAVDNTSDISIYSINYPPISVADLSQEIPAETTEKSSTWVYILIAVLAVLAVLAIGGYYIMSRNKKSTHPAPLTKKTEESTDKDKGNDKQILINTPKEENNRTNSYDFSKACICFLGGFHVRDKSGEDITSTFTPTLKALLILLILFTKEDPKGISGKKMLQLLWSDKTQESAKNNRNVYLSKLRVALEKIGSIDIINQSGFWSIKFGDDVICDYNEAMDYFSLIKENKMDDETQFNKLLELLLRGTLLPNTEIDWIDKYKSNFSDLTIDTLSLLLTEKNNISNTMKLRIADTLFQHDYINEEALRTKCIILTESGKMGLAKTCYDNYCKEYSSLLGEEYKYSLSDIIKRN
ncbi:hypothetical protein [Bacteroides sp. 51]|uniref:hypothetical protein n=1 Tax=Bacteroides sp. 51 TaxID=2302938 RepID=UPI0013D880F2|nr:hypothetical protein [Bacteroides sp. 51]NDV84055.1 hypothetical protein [Bacteroides sp. 51]